MGFLSVLRAIKASENEARVLIVGLDCSGKTTVVSSLLGKSLSDIAPTLGFKIDTWRPQNTSLAVALWDVGGQQTIRTYWRNYFSSTDALIWVVDSTDRGRMDVCRKALKEVLYAERLQGCPVMVLCNKQDVSSALSVEEISAAITLTALCSNRKWAVFPCSAMNRQGLDEAFSWLLSELLIDAGNAREDDNLETAIW